MTATAKRPVVKLTTAFGTTMTIRNAVISDHAWGEMVEGLATIEGQLFEEIVCTRLDTATAVRWYPGEGG